MKIKLQDKELDLRLIGLEIVDQFVNLIKNNLFKIILVHWKVCEDKNARAHQFVELFY